MTGTAEMKVDRLKMRRFEGRNAVASIALEGSKVQLRKVSLETAGGQMNITGHLSAIPNQPLAADFDMKMRKIDMKQLFYMGGNFGQKSITHNNIRGQVNMTAQLAAKVDKNYDLIPSQTAGKVKLKLQNGSIKDFDPLVRVGGYIGREEEWRNIQFTDITSEININGTMITVPTMEIASTVANLYLKGKYDIVAEDSLDFRITIPFKNIGRSDSIPAKWGKEFASSNGVRLKVLNKDGKPKVSLDLSRAKARVRGIFKRKKRREDAASDSLPPR